MRLHLQTSRIHAELNLEFTDHFWGQILAARRMIRTAPPLLAKSRPPVMRQLSNSRDKRLCGSFASFGFGWNRTVPGSKTGRRWFGEQVAHIANHIVLAVEAHGLPVELATATCALPPFQQQAAVVQTSAGVARFAGRRQTLGTHVLCWT
jgi:hypothetical protein